MNLLVMKCLSSGYEKGRWNEYLVIIRYLSAIVGVFDGYEMSNIWRACLDYDEEKPYETILINFLLSVFIHAF